VEVEVPGVVGGQEEAEDPTQISGGSGDEVGDGRRGGFRVGVGEEDLVGLVCQEEERVSSVLVEVEEEEERERKKKREKREMAKIMYRVVLGFLEMVVLQGNMKGGCPGSGGDGGFCIVCLSWVQVK
jgi:hypothetical protein